MEERFSERIQIVLNEIGMTYKQWFQFATESRLNCEVFYKVTKAIYNFDNDKINQNIKSLDSNTKV